MGTSVCFQRYYYRLYVSPHLVLRFQVDVTELTAKQSLTELGRVINYLSVFFFMFLSCRFTKQNFLCCRFTKQNLLRIYPKGIRFDSSNYNPLIGWTHGAQMVAFNMQVSRLGFFLFAN